MLASASGELYTRSPPNRFCSPHVTLKTPPLPLTLPRYCSRETSATSSPKTTMRGSRAISSRRQALRRSTIVVGVAGELRRVLGVEHAPPSGPRRGNRRTAAPSPARAAGPPSASSAAAEHLRVHLCRHATRGPAPSRALPRPAAPRSRRIGSRGRVGLALRGGPVQHLVVGERVRVGADDVRVDERRALALAAVRDGPARSPRSDATKSQPSTSWM